MKKLSATAHTLQVAADITAERMRQKEQEGWTLKHDDEHEGGTLAMAAVCYARENWQYHGDVPGEWPWSASWWKPKKQPRQNLVVACALLMAEIERMDRNE